IMIGAALVARAYAVERPVSLQTRAAGLRECFMFARLDDEQAVTSDTRECDQPTAPASTFKIPHALIALETGVIDERTVVPWDGTAYDFASWRQDHTLESA